MLLHPAFPLWFPLTSWFVETSFMPIEFSENLLESKLFRIFLFQFDFSYSQNQTEKETQKNLSSLAHIARFHLILHSNLNDVSKFILHEWFLFRIRFRLSLDYRVSFRRLKFLKLWTDFWNGSDFGYSERTEKIIRVDAFLVLFVSQNAFPFDFFWQLDRRNKKKIFSDIK